ncbi:hypothetical protein H0H93_012445, partial [Arthromyces matolae]
TIATTKSELDALAESVSRTPSSDKDFTKLQDFFARTIAAHTSLVELEKKHAESGKLQESFARTVAAHTSPVEHEKKIAEFRRFVDLKLKYGFDDLHFVFYHGRITQEMGTPLIKLLITIAQTSMQRPEEFSGPGFIEHELVVMNQIMEHHFKWPIMTELEKTQADLNDYFHRSRIGGEGHNSGS